MTAIRPVDRIPPDLRNVLPRRGFANYFEAQALVKRLESLAGSGNGATLDDVAIVALYEGQVELIAKLIERSETLQGRTFPLGLPEKFRQSEYNTVLLSLTRSHSHRAVAFGEHPQDLALALTRARRRLYLFADPGNLIKRAGWQGPLEHLDAAAAALEGQRIAQLARYLQGQGRWQDGFRAERS
ncbi:MAG: AAA domain-containing protein [Gemmataceae bacterium]